MRKNAIYSLAVLSILVFGATMVRPAGAADYSQVGVKVGDTAFYDVQKTYDSYEIMVDILVYGIVGTTITLNLTYYDAYWNPYPEQWLGDIYNGAGNPLYLFLITPHLQAGEAIYSSASLLIQETVTMKVAEVSRSVNHHCSGDPGSGWYLDAYWDQATGMIVQLRFYYSLMGWLNVTMTSTSLWSNQLPMTILIVIGEIFLFVFGAAIGFFVGKGRSEKKKKKGRSR